MNHAVSRPDPLRKPALACAGLVGGALLFAAFGPEAELPRPIDRAAPVAAIDLAFADMPGGVVAVRDAQAGREIARIAPGEGGFVRSTMRGLATERKRRAISDRPAFRLVRFSDGSLVLADPATDRTIVLNAFGSANEAAFAAFLDNGRPL